ncbi:MAG TPA: S41 family peptidase [Pyrinomonadaceae bacterium]
MRNRTILTLGGLLIVALSLPTFIYSQQSATVPPAPGVAGVRGRETVTSGAKASAVVERDVAEALTVIQDNYIDGPKLDYNTVFKSSINGMLHTLDPHSNFFDKAEFDEFRTDQRSQYFGIGASVIDLRLNGDVSTYIRATFPDSPAGRAGLLYGDRILEINGEDMRKQPYYEVSKRLRGPLGTPVKIMVEHAAGGRTETVEITRDAVPQPSIPETYMIKPGVGYIALTGGFNFTTGEEFRAALESLRAKNMQMLILDLRGNGGGLVKQAVSVARTFLARGQLILTQKGRIRGSSDTVVSDNDAPDNTPLVVLVNRGTASASEIVAGALQDHDRALIVGETSFGKGLVQIPFPMDYGTAVMLTIAHYYTPSGRLIQRDYSQGGFWDYYSQGGSYRAERQKTQVAPSGPESHTDTGRVVYGGGGIAPDDVVAQRTLTPAQARLADPLFAFSLELARGHIKGFESYKIERPIEFGHDLKDTEFPITDTLYQAFKDFVAAQSSFKVTAQQLDREREFVEARLRHELATASYGTITGYQVFNAEDPQISRGIQLLPRARELAQLALSKRKPSE